MTHSPDQRRNRSARLTAFLNDEIIAGVLSRLERKYYEEFIVADSSEKRAATQGKVRVLRDLEREFQVVLDDGELAMLEIAEAEKKDQDRKK